MRLTYHPEAEAELVEATAFYEARSPGLGDRFLREFDAAVAEIQASPGLWAVVEDDLRRHTLGRFPFGIYYRIRDDELRILVVMHHSQHPDYCGIAWPSDRRPRGPDAGRVAARWRSMADQPGRGSRPGGSDAGPRAIA